MDERNARGGPAQGRIAGRIANLRFGIAVLSRVGLATPQARASHTVDLGQTRRTPTARRKMSSGSRRRVKRERHPLNRKIEILPATRRDDAIPQRADVVGDGLPVAGPGSLEVRSCIAADPRR